MADPNTASEQLCALLTGLKDHRKVGYEKLAELASCSRGTAQNYISKPTHRRDRGILSLLLDALDATDDQRADALRLHQLTLRTPVNPIDVGWTAAAADANCTVWNIEQFTPGEATVHAAIDRTSAHPSQHRLATLPTYVSRASDKALREDIAAAVRGHLKALIVLRGGPSTGKTRSLFEAVNDLSSEWTVVRPRTPAALRDLARTGLLRRRKCVVWLNELQNFLGVNGTGLSVDVLRDLLTTRTGLKQHPTVVVATLWPEKLHNATAPDDSLSDNRDLLTAANQWVCWHDIPQDLSASERATARELASSSGDARLRTALTDPDRVGFTQTLAGAYELLHHYNNAPHLLHRLLLDAAADARRLGLTRPLSAALLRDISVGFWREERGRTFPPSGWFDTALNYATTPLRSTEGVQALIPLGHASFQRNGSEDSDFIEYDLANYLEQHLAQTRTGHPIVDSTWTALYHHSAVAGGVDLVTVGRSAEYRGRFRYAEAFYRASDSPSARYHLANWLAKQPGREGEVEQTYRDAITAGDADAHSGLARWLADQPGRENEIEQIYRDAITAGHVHAHSGLARWLADQPGRENEIEQAHRNAVTAGNLFGYRGLADWLATQSGRESETEQTYRDAITAGRPLAYDGLAKWLAKQPGRESETEQTHRDAITAGHFLAYDGLADWLAAQPGRESETEQAYRDATATGSVFAYNRLANWLAKQPGRESETERTYRDAITTGKLSAHTHLADWLAKQPGRESETEQAYRDAITASDDLAHTGLAKWLAKQPGRESDTEQAYRDAITAGAPTALTIFKHWLSFHNGRDNEAKQIEKFGMETDAH